MGSEASATPPRASVRSEAFSSARPRIRQHLNDAVVAQRVVQQLEEDIQAAEASWLTELPEGRQVPNVAFSAQFRPDGEPAVGLLESEAIIDPPVGDQLLELRDRDRVFPHPLHNASAIDCDRRADFHLAHPISVHAAVRFVLYLLPHPHGSSRYLAGDCGAADQAVTGLQCAACPDAAEIAAALPCGTVPLVPAHCIAHVIIQYKPLVFDKQPLFVMAAHKRCLRQGGCAYSRANPPTREAPSAQRSLRTRQRVACIANRLGNGERSRP